MDYISREAVMSKCDDIWNNADETTQTGVDTINTIDEITDFIESLPIADVQPVNQWISVKDRLPDESCECLGIVDGEVTEVSYSPKCKELICVWSMCDADGFKPLPDDAVTHWMPMPQPPQD